MMQKISIYNKMVFLWRKLIITSEINGIVGQSTLVYAKHLDISINFMF